MDNGQKPLGERVAAIEMELHMRGPKQAEFEQSLEALTRQMDRVVLLGTQALESIHDLKVAQDRTTGTLTRSLGRLRADLDSHINRSLVDILRQRSKEIAYSVAIAGLLGLQFPATREQIQVVLPQMLGGQ